MSAPRRQDSCHKNYYKNKLYFREYKFPDKQYWEGRDVAVLLLRSPFNFDDYVRPACLPPLNWTSKFSGGLMVTSGMGMINNFESTSELKIASIQMLKKSECKKLLENTKSFTFPYKGRRPDSNIKLLISIFRWYNLWQGCNKYMRW